jgi:hypothetical protein
MLSAIRHHNTGVALFHPVLLTPAMVIVNRDAVFAFSCIIALYAFGIERLSASEPDTSPATRILQVLLLIRNSVLILKSDATGMTQSPWSAMMLHPIQIQQAFDYILPDEIQEMVSRPKQHVPDTPVSRQPITLLSRPSELTLLSPCCTMGATLQLPSSS